jgi:hypothetical protein
MKKSIYIPQLVTVILLLVVLGLPLFQDITHVFTLKTLEGENRAMAKMPVADINQLDTFPSQFTAFYNDHFPFRAFFFQFDYRILLKKSPIKQVVFGKDNWLFSAGKELAIYQGMINYSEYETERVAQNLESRRKKYEEMGIKFYVVIAPTAYEIYSEKLPSYILRAKKTLTDKFCQALQNTNIPFIYLKDELLKNKTAGQLFHLYDNHWNELGAYFAYNATVNLIKKDFPEIPVYSYSDFELTPEFKKDGSMINMLNDYYKGIFFFFFFYKVSLRDSAKQWFYVEKAGYPIPENFPYPSGFEIVGETPLKHLPRILTFRDSFYNAVRLFSFNSFSRSLVIWDDWKFRENMDIVLNEKPDIVLIFLCEIHIPNLFSE